MFKKLSRGNSSVFINSKLFACVGNRERITMVPGSGGGGGGGGGGQIYLEL